jgi:type IV secretion system protein TrbL
VLGNVFSSGVKVLVLAVIVGIGSTIFGQFTSGFHNPPTIDDALTLILAALALLGLSIFGAGIANGLIAGGPQLGTGAAVSTGLAAGGAAIAAGAATTGAIGAAGRAIGGAAGTGASAAGGAAAAFRAGGVGGVAKAAGTAAASPLRRAAASLRQNYQSGAQATTGGGGTSNASTGEASRPPAWANRMRRSQVMQRGASTAHNAVRSGDHPSGGSSVDLSEGS